MTDKLYERLTEAKQIKECIQEQNARKEALLYGLLPSGIAYDKDKVQTSPEDTLSRTMATVSEIDDYIRNVLDPKYQKAVDNVMELLNNITCTNYKCIMIKWYIGCKRASQIAYEMNYTEDGVYKIHRRMCKILEEYV